MLLITGGGGFVGQNLVNFFGPRRPVATTYLSRPAAPDTTPPAFRLDVRDAESVFSVFERAAPEVVIHAAANKNVRFCEEHPDEAYRINALGTRIVARACREFGAKMIYVSTDLVFSCTDGNYREDDPPRPALAYGESKLQGERFAREELADVAVCRSGGVYGQGAPLLRWLSAEIEAGRTVECFTDVFNTPTYAENLAEMMDAIIRRGLAGVFHTAGRQRVSRYEFFRAYADAFGLDAGLLSPVSAAGLSEKLLLQRDSSLCVEQTSARLGVAFDSVTEGFNRLKARGGV
ncbi:MAG TPA: SDR family oxidoreductase [Pyrinomonadaceae bacterium]